MDVGMTMVFAAYGCENIGDNQVWDEELRLFAKEVLPVLQRWKSDAIASAAAE